MPIPEITGVIRRRVLLNYRADPAVIARTLPSCFKPVLVQDQAIVGICLIRLENIRPSGMPAWLGVSSENAAHRVAVQWTDEQNQPQQGVYIPRRDTNSYMNALFGGRLFPGHHHLARFEVTDDRHQIAMRVQTKNYLQPLVDFSAKPADTFPEDSIFSSLEASSAFFEQGCIGYSSRPDSCTLDGLRLETQNWQVTPLQVAAVHSAYFDDPAHFPPGSITFDHALLMRDITHSWHAEPAMEDGSST